MADEINKEFVGYRELFKTEDEKRAFDQKIKLLLEQHGVDYVRGVCRRVERHPKADAPILIAPTSHPESGD